MSLYLQILVWFYFAIGFGFFIGGMCTAKPNGRDTGKEITWVFFGCILAWPVLAIILLWE